MRFDDPAYVREQYATEAGLAARASLYLYGEGTDARDIVVEEVRRRGPKRVVEAGCGWGELAERIAREAGCKVIATDLSPRMVELAAERGLDARLADVQALPFRDGEFDVAVVAWMLYHVPDLDRALSELGRVVGPGGVLVAVTNGAEDFAELWTLVGRDLFDRSLTFRSENGEEILGRHFASVARRDLRQPITFRDPETMRRYIGSSVLGAPLVDRVPDFDEPFVATKIVTVFVATK